MHVTADVKLGTENQVNAGILANVVVYLWNEDKSQVVFQLEDFCIRRTRDGRPFVAGPQREYTAQGQKRYRKIVKVAPQEEIGNNEGYRARFENYIMSEYNRTLQQSGQPQQAPQYQQSQQAPQQAPQQQYAAPPTPPPAQTPAPQPQQPAPGPAATPAPSSDAPAW